MSQLHVTEKLFGTTTLTEQQSIMVRKTYALLSISLVSAALGGYIGTTSEQVLSLFIGPQAYIGWIAAMIALNGIPYLALWASKKSPFISLPILALDGFISGIVLSPILAFAAMRAEVTHTPNLIWTALGVTASIFLAITGYIFLGKRRFSAKAGLLTGLFMTLIVATVFNLIFHIGALGMMISIGVGVLGIFMLVYATSDVLNNPNYRNPVQGALMLFAALFNIFVSTLNLLLRLSRN